MPKEYSGANAPRKIRMQDDVEKLTRGRLRCVNQLIEV